MTTSSFSPSSPKPPLERWLRDLLTTTAFLTWPLALLRKVAEISYPRRCPACKVDLQPSELKTTGFCLPCSVSLDEAHEGGCIRCGAVTSDGAHHPRGWLCEICETEPPPYKRAVGFWRYGGALRDAIITWKNQPAMHLCAPLADLYISGFMKLSVTERPPVDIVVPVPSLPSHLAKRGFNTAGTLAQTFTHALRQTRLNTSIAFSPGALGFSRVGLAAAGTHGLGRRQRLKRTSSVFQARSRLVATKHVWLVDDVMTTGATVAAASKALLEAGAASVSVGVLARVEGPRGA